MNRERLKTLRDHLAGLPDERVDMSLWSTERHDCGTACCIGGWAERLWADQSAGVALGLDDYQHDALFFPAGWSRNKLTRLDAIAAIDSMLANPDDDALPVWPEKAVAA